MTNWKKLRAEKKQAPIVRSPKPGIVIAPAAAETVVKPSEDRAAFRSRILSKLPERSQAIAGILARVRSEYVRTGRDRLLDETLTRFLEKIVIEADDGFAPGGVLFITGESGAGKTHAIAEMIRSCAALQPEKHSFGAVRPVVSVSLKGKTTIKLLAQRILEASGYPVKETAQSVLWNDLAEMLAMRQVLIVHIDETQHLMRKTEKDADRKSLADALKGAMNHRPWPVSFILSGLPYVTELARLDEQFERRGETIKLPDITMPDERRIVEKIVTQLTSVAGLHSAGILQSEIPLRIAHASNYRFGRICQVVIHSIQEALHAGSDALQLDHFAKAYLRLSHARGHDHRNPFLADDWHRLPGGSFLFEEHET